MKTHTELETLTALRSNAITGELESKVLKKMATVTYEQKFSAEELVYNAGDLGRSLYIVRSGEVVIEMPVSDESWVPVLTLGPGDLFGWSSLFPAQRKNARARTTLATRLLAIDAQKLRELWQHDEDLEYAIVHLTSKIMVDRIKATRQKLVEAFTVGVR